MTNSVWATLSKIDCNEHVEQKGKFSYLAWTWCWSMVKERYPDASFHIEPDITFPDGTVEVRMTVTIEDQKATMWLPVMDFKNNAKPNPTARDISDTRMRCLVKCVAVGYGLGHYIYAGESLPQQGDPYTPEQLATFKMLIASEDGWGLKRFANEAGQDAMDGLFNSAPQGEKTKLKAKCREVVTAANTALKTTVAAIQEALADGKGDVIGEIYDELSDIEREFVNKALTEIEQVQIENLTKELV